MSRPNLERLAKFPNDRLTFHTQAEEALDALPWLIEKAHEAEAWEAAANGALGQLHWIDEADVTPTVWSYVQGARGYLALASPAEEPTP